MLKHLEMKCNRKASFHPCELDLKTPEKKYDSSEIESNFFLDLVQLFTKKQGYSTLSYDGQINALHMS